MLQQVEVPEESGCNGVINGVLVGITLMLDIYIDLT
jgi:hypothetical protein